MIRRVVLLVAVASCDAGGLLIAHDHGDAGACPPCSPDLALDAGCTDSSTVAEHCCVPEGGP